MGTDINALYCNIHRDWITEVPPGACSFRDDWSDCLLCEGCGWKEVPQEELEKEGDS